MIQIAYCLGESVKGLFIFLSLMMVGCVEVAPNLKLPDRSIKSCPQSTLPPIPNKVMINIDGDKVSADSGGELLLRNYVLARELLK